MKQQTAVEWLYNKIKSLFEHDGDLLEVVQFSFEHAKEMEKEQIINAFECVDLDEDYRGEQYYNETFKSE